MRIAEYKQIDTEVVETVMPVLDEEGNETGETEIVRKEYPIMGIVYRDATPEEEAEALAAQAEAERHEAQREPTPEERLAAIEDALAEMMEVLL